MKAGNRSKPVASVKATSADPDDAVLENLKEICPTATFFTTTPSVGPPIQAQTTQQPTVD